MGSGGGGTQQTTSTTAQNLPAWEQPIAKAYLSSLLGYVFPGATVPSNWFSSKGFSYPTGGATDQSGGATQQAMQNIQNSALGTQTLANPTTNALLSPTIAGSPYLQNIAATNPNAIWGATSPAAASQLGQFYTGQSFGQPSSSGGATSNLASWVQGLS